MKKVSVIIPVYNSEKTLKESVDSVLNQTLEDLEIILVDDGSKDLSAGLCEDYRDKYANIKVVHKENGGLVSARKAGLNLATGEYVGYVDSDDWIEPSMYEKLYSIAKEQNVDMVSSGYIYEGGYQSFECDSVDEGKYVGEKYKELLEKAIFNMDVQDLGLRGSLCCKLFKREILDKVQNLIPDEISFSEDKLCAITYLLNAESAYVVKDCYYHYIMNSESMTVEPKPDYLNKVNAIYKYFCTLYEHPRFTENMRAQAELYVTQQLIKGINSRMGFSIKNLMWIDSEWMYKIPEKANIILCGSGALLNTYARQVENSERLHLVTAVDNPADVSKYEFDYVVITYKYLPKVEEIKKELVERGIEENKILWFEQKEIFWKYAKDAGLC